VTPPAPAPGAAARRRRSSRTIVFVAAAIALLVGAGAVGAFALGSGGGGDTANADEPTPTTLAGDPNGEPTTEHNGDEHAALPDCTSSSGRCAFINDIQVEGDRYVARYATESFDPLIFEPDAKGTPDDHHVHFFFDTTTPENAGTNGNPPGDWIVWDRDAGGGDLRFDALRVGDRGDAERMCVLVADSNHAVEPDSGNCVDLP
jgi:hypothetical protein